MSREGTSWKAWARLGVCAVLLAWIGHAIFSSEAESIVRAQGQDWDALGAGKRMRLAWVLGPAELGRTLVLVEPWALGISLIFMGSTVVLGAWRWRMVMQAQGLALSLGRSLEISLVAQFFNAFLLGSTGGDLIKAYYAARETRHKKTEAVVAVLADRLIGLVAMLLFAGVMMLVNLRFLVAHHELAAVVAVVLLMLAGCGGVLALALWGGVSKAFPKARTWLRRLPQAQRIEEALESFRQLGRNRGCLWRAFGVSVLLNLACVFQLMAIGAGFGLNVPWHMWMVIVPTIICIAALPITPSGLGVRENLYVITLAGPGLHVSATHALSVSLLAYFGFLVWSLVGGVVYLMVRERRHLDEVARDEG